MIAQRLPRRVCRVCAQMEAPTHEELQAVGVDPDKAEPDWAVPRPVGCGQCRGTGYRGRIGIFEIMQMTEPLRELALQNASAYQIRQQAVKEGMRSLRDDGWEKALNGITSVEEVLRLTPSAGMMG